MKGQSMSAKHPLFRELFFPQLSRYWMQSDWIAGGFRWASDVACCVRVPCKLTPSKPRVVPFPPVKVLPFKRSLYEAKPTELPKLPRKKQTLGVPIGTTGIGWKYLRLMHKHGCKIYMPLKPGPVQPMLFTFGKNGTGILMPCRLGASA